MDDAVDFVIMSLTSEIVCMIQTKQDTMKL